MAITSEDIHNQSFTVDRKGYDVDEVDVFLEHVAAEIDGLNAQIEELLARIDELNNNQMGFDDDEPMDMDAAFAEPAMPEPEPEAVKEEAADTTSVLSADEDARIAELEKQLSEKETDASAIANALVTAQRSAQEVLMLPVPKRSASTTMPKSRRATSSTVRTPRRPRLKPPSKSSIVPTRRRAKRIPRP